VLLRQVELALLLKIRARVALAEGLVLGPFLGELLGELCSRCHTLVVLLPADRCNGIAVGGPRAHA
jgi:hypothetical protein